MYADTDWSDEYAASLETEIAERGFQRGAEDDAQPEYDSENLPVYGYVYQNPRVSPMEDMGNGRVRYTILCDDGQDVELRALIVKLNKKLGKWDQVIDVVAEEVVFKEHWLKQRPKIRQVRLTIESPAVAGKHAKLIGAFELAEDGESIYRHALNGATEDDIAPFLARWNECDHCGYKRARHASFICQTEDGNRVVIGRQCSRDFLGLEAAELLAREAVRKLLSSGGETDEDDDDERPKGGGFARYFHVETLVKKAYIVARKLGGYSKEVREAYYTHLAALDGAKDYGRDRTYTKLREEYAVWMEKHAPDPLDLEDFANYVMSASGDFGENLRIALGCEWAKPKRKNLIIAGIGLYVGRAMKRKAAEATQTGPAAKLLPGKEKDRVTFVGLVERCTAIAGYYGPKTVVAIVGDDGERCVHFCSGEERPEAGKRYQITGTIKRHGTNRLSGGPETEITRGVYKDVPQNVLL